MMNTVKCPLCNTVLLVVDGQTRTDALIKHLIEIKHNGEENGNEKAH